MPNPRSVKLSPLRTSRPSAVVGHPLDQSRGVHAALQDEVLEQPADLVVRERRDDAGLQAEAATEPARHVVFTAALPDLELSGRADAPFAGVESEHDFAEGDLVVFAGASRFDVENCHVSSSFRKREPGLFRRKGDNQTFFGGIPGRILQIISAIRRPDFRWRSRMGSASIPRNRQQRSMATTLTIHDETASGTKTNTFTLDCLTETMTVRELIRARIYQEVQDYNQREPERFRGLVEPGEAERTLNGFKLRQKRKIDWEAQFVKALEAFDRNGFFVLVGDRQAESLDETFPVRVDTEISFVKLTPLVGG